MFRFLLLVVFCLAMCGCGEGGDSTNPAVIKVSDYQGFYAGTIEYTSSRNGGGEAISFNVDENGMIYCQASNEMNNKIISLSRMTSLGKVKGITNLVTSYPYAVLNVSYNGVIDLDHSGSFDITYTFIGEYNGSFRIYGVRPIIIPVILPSNTIISQNNTVTLYNNSIFSNSNYPVADSYNNGLDYIKFNWIIKSAPTGSIATIRDSENLNDLNKTFSPDMKGVYVITLTAWNALCPPTKTEVVINVI